MKALLLCGGIGKRMFPIAEDKLLLNFLGGPCSGTSWTG